MKAHLLVVEDDATTLLSFVYRLRYAGYQVTEASDGEMAITLLEDGNFDVVITDIILGSVDGMEVLHVARQQAYSPEVIVLTGHGSFDTAVLALREGAFDYLVKPCTSEQLLVSVERAAQQHHSNQQVRAAARTLATALYGTSLEKREAPIIGQIAGAALPATRDPASITIGDLIIGPTRMAVLFQGQRVRLTPTEYAVLRYLAEHVGQLCSSHDIIRTTHQYTVDDAEAQALVKPHIFNLRKKLAADYLLTERGIGYRLVDPGATETKVFA